MGPFQWFLFVYVLGGITFLPLSIIFILAFIYYTSPPPAPQSTTRNDDPSDLQRSGDEKLIFKTGTDDLEEKFHRRHDSDVAAGYFAVCREFVPGGVNGKPPDKLSPAGEVVSSESPSVYQTMYRSIFERKEKASLDPSKDAAGRNVKRPNNIFYVVLTHAHLMLYDDIQQLDVRYVISLAYHHVDIYGGHDDEQVPEGELWVKRNCIRLKRKEVQIGDKAASLPFFLFGESLSDKEDLYHALLKNQQRSSDDVPEAEEFDVKHIVNLVQKLHSSEEQLQTRWLNAFIGRLFLAIYKTPELEGFIQEKLMKKISRVRKPTFITKLSLRKIDTGTAAPFFTNLRLKDLTVSGDCMIEADVEYTGNFKLEIGATARIDLGKRFGAREVEMVLAVTVKRIQGHALARFKPPPSNRIWFTFEKMPQLDLTVEPIVSSRQITYTIVLRAIESRIREVVAESLVLPFWDDLPFLRTEGQTYRGGIWKREKAGSIPVEITSEMPEDEAEAGPATQIPDSIDSIKRENRNMSTLSMPLMADSKKPLTSQRTVASLNENPGDTSDKTSPGRVPRIIRSPSFARTIDPKLTPNYVGTESAKQDGDATPKRESAASVLKDLSTRSANGTPPGSSAGSPSLDSSYATAMKNRSSSITSKGSSESMKASSRQTTTTFTNTDANQSSRPTTPSASANNSRPSSLNEDGKPKTLVQHAKSMANTDQRKQAVASASATAQKWSTMGWGVLSKNRPKADQGRAPSQSQAEDQSTASDGRPSVPMGRGQPLPPPGVPLPRPPRQTVMSSIGSIVPKRKPILPQRPENHGPTNSKASSVSNSKEDLSNVSRKTAPPLPDRRRRQSSRAELSREDVDVDDVLVVEAPTESAPTSPMAERKREESELHDGFFGHGEDDNEQNHNGRRERSSDEEGTDRVPEPLTAIKSKADASFGHVPSAPQLPTSQDADTADDEIDAAETTTQHLPSVRPQPPDLPPRSPTSPVPLSPAPSIKRKPIHLRANATSSNSPMPSEDTVNNGPGVKTTPDEEDTRLPSSTSSSANSRRLFDEDEDERPMSPGQSESVNAERRLRMMEGASWGGGYNE